MQASETSATAEVLPEVRQLTRTCTAGKSPILTSVLASPWLAPRQLPTVLTDISARGEADGPTGPSSTFCADSAGACDPTGSLSDTAQGTAPDLAKSAQAYRRYWRRLTPALIDEQCIQEQIREIDGIATQLEAIYRQRQSKRWRDWVNTSIAEGGQKLYKWVRKEDGLGQAEEVETAASQLQRIEKEWKAIWSQGSRGITSATAEAWPAVPIAAQMIRAAGRSFKSNTAVGIEGIRPRHVDLLPDKALEALAVLLNYSEMVGLPPVIGASVVFLPKPTGGERPIGILPTLYRLWCRCRRSQATAWEREHDRKYFWAAAGRSSSQAVHLQGVRLEEARAHGQQAVALLTDLAKAYEHVNHEKLAAFAATTGFPLRFSCVSLLMEERVDW